jgi:hypothetical protein
MSQAGLPDFSWCKIPKRGKIYQMATGCTKRPLNIYNGRKIDQMVIKYTKIFHLQDPPKFTQIGIFGLKTNHLATLVTGNSELLCLV